MQEVEKLFSHQYFDLIVIFVKRAALQIFCKKSSALCFALVLKIFMFFVITRVRESLLPYSGDILNICGKNFPETSNAVFRLERATEVLELTYLGKYFACVNAN